MNSSADSVFAVRLFLGFAVFGLALGAVDPIDSDVIVTRLETVSDNRFVRLRGASSVRDTGSSSRRLRVRDSSCTLYKMDTEYSTLEDGEIEHDTPETQWACEFEKDYAYNVLGLSDPLVELVGVMTEDIGEYFDAPAARGAGLDEPGFTVPKMEDFVGSSSYESGKTHISFPDGIIDRYENTMIARMPPTKSKRKGGHKKILDEGDDRRLRSISPPLVVPKTGERKTIVVRMSFEGKPEGPGASQAKIVGPMYENIFSLKKKYEACSYNQLIIKPFEGKTRTNEAVSNGIVDVTYPTDMGEELQNDIKELKGGISKAKVLRLTREAARAKLGELDEQFDFVLFCLPEEVEGFLALAILNRWDSYYTSPWCTRPSFALHEVGHSLGMEHAGEYDVYDDKVGYMGFSYNDKNGPNMCFNPANNHYLGWYQKQSDWYNPLNEIGIKKFIMNGIDDYNPDDASVDGEKRLVVLQIFQSDQKSDYYIGYNKAVGINSGTFEDENEILIVKRNGPGDTSATTKKVATLAKGDSFEIENFNGIKDQTVSIKFEALSDNKRDATIKVDSYDKSTLQFRNNPDKNCDWVKKRPRQRCFLVWKKKKVKKVWCPNICSGVTRSKKKLKGEKDCSNSESNYDRPEFTFRGDSNKNCDWVREDKEKRCAKRYKGRRVSRYWCPIACEVC